jgi:hypothetical protein
MSKKSKKTRRVFLKATAGVTGSVSIAGCNSGNDENGDQEPTETDDKTTNTPSSEPSYSIQASPLQYDLTSLATSEADQHDQAYVEDNYHAEPGVTVLNNGEEADLEQLGEVHLENENGEQVQTTEDGYVPEYAVEDGQELIVRAEVNGETLQDSVTVSKDLPDNFLIDASIVEDGEVLYETPWNTPYQFDSHTTDRQAFLERRAEKRDEVAENNVMSRINPERVQENWDKLSSGNYTEQELKKFMLANARAEVVGDPYNDGIGVGVNQSVKQAANEEKILRNLDFLPYEEVFIG